MSSVIPFQFEAHAVRVQVDDASQPWFNANDVCEALQLGNARQALESHVDADDVQKLDTISRNGHSGYQILWNQAVVERLKGVAS